MLLVRSDFGKVLLVRSGISEISEMVVVCVAHGSQDQLALLLVHIHFDEGDVPLRGGTVSTEILHGPVCTVDGIGNIVVVQEGEREGVPVASDVLHGSICFAAG